MNITRIDAFEGYKQDITLYCKRKRNGRGYHPRRFAQLCAKVRRHFKNSYSNSVGTISLL